MAESRVTDQAYVTLATNDSYGLGALTLGYSLRRVGTTRTLVCMVTSELSHNIREELSRVYDLVEVNILDSHDSVNLGLLTRPDLGVTFTKLHCWRLTQFSKCVFMDADTLVLQNIDDLFEREEFSAASDIGWPDCFNSGVFVFKPSEETYRGLLQLALTRGSFDGGDQGLLNAYFSDWATKDIKYHLPFLYNVVAQTFYTYKPAYKRFGKDAKVLHFIGANKPWHGTYRPETGSLDCPGELGMICQEFLKLWWEIFTANVKLAKDFVKYGGISTTHLQETESETSGHGSQLRWEKGDADYLGVDKYENIQKQIELKSGKVWIVPAVTREEIKPHKEQMTASLFKQTPAPEVSSSAVGQKLVAPRPGVLGESVHAPIIKVREESHSVSAASGEPSSAEIDRRYRWETGQIDYMGVDSFENIMKRLDEKTKRSEPIESSYDRPLAIMPAPTYKSAGGQIGKLSDKDTSLQKDVEPSKIPDENVASGLGVSGTLKLQSAAPLARIGGLLSEAEVFGHLKEVPQKEIRSGSFKLQASAGVKMSSSSKEQSAIESNHDLEWPPTCEIVQSHQHVPSGSQAAQLSNKRVQVKKEPGRYIFRPAIEGPLAKSIEDLKKFLESEHEPTQLQNLPGKVVLNQEEGEPDAFTSFFKKEFLEQHKLRSTEHFVDIVLAREEPVQLHESDPKYDIKVFKRTYRIRSQPIENPPIPRVKVASTSPTPPRLLSGVTSITVVKKEGTAKK